MATIYTVSQLNNEIKDLLDAVPGYRGLMVQGEISNYKAHSSGHHYMTLKDENAAINAVMFRSDAMRLKFRLQNGMKVIVKARVSSFPRTGAVQLYVSEIIPDGAGALNLAFEQLKAKLQAEGLFSERYKKPIPSCPDSIALVTSPTGAAVRDMIRILGRRWPLAKVVLYPAQVQGQGAAESIARAIALANAIGEADVILCGRGGGSMEDLWAFNEEIVARAIYDCQIPIISAVGHETDFTIADFVADRRAATPSNAAEMAVPDLREILAGLDGMRQHLQTALSQHLQETRLALMTLEKRLAACDPNQRLTALEKRLGGAKMRLEHQMSQRISALTPRLGMARIRLDSAAEQNLQRKTERLHRQKLHLQALNPEKVLERGYALVLDGGRVLPDRAAARTHSQMTLRFRDGEMRVMQPNKEGAYGSEKEADV